MVQNEMRFEISNPFDLNVRFTGTAAIEWLLKKKVVSKRESAVYLGTYCRKTYNF